MFLCSLFSKEDFQLILRRRKIINRLKSRTSNIAPCSNFPGVCPPTLHGQDACASRPSSLKVPQQPEPPWGSTRAGHRNPASGQSHIPGWAAAPPALLHFAGLGIQQGGTVLKLPPPPHGCSTTMSHTCHDLQDGGHS